MGARFDKWLARPSTLHFLRQLVGPEPAAVRTRRPHWNKSPGQYPRCYSTAQPERVTYTPGHASTDQGSLAAVAAASIETSREQRKRVAQELGLRLPREEDDERLDRQRTSTPSSTSYSDLLYSEARVREFSTARGLLIDHPMNHVNIEAWCKILEYRKRTDGFAGILDVWAGMRKRKINLPVDGPYADVMWTTFLYAVIVRNPDETKQRLLRELFEHAKTLKAKGTGFYRSFHTALVGRFLRVIQGGAKENSRSTSTKPELEWHRAACELGFCDGRSLPFLVMHVLKSAHLNIAFARWQELYRHDQIYFGNDARGIYDLCMPLVLLHANRNPALVVAWHNFLVGNNDVPSPELASNQAVKYLLDISSSGEMSSANHLQLKHLSAILTEDRGDTRPPTSPLLSRALMSGLVGDVHGIKPKVISDKFCARMFATQAFSLETSIRGLALLGTETLGPIALRELAVRAGTPGKFKEKLVDLKDAGIAISPSKYAHVLHTVVSNSQTDLFQTLLASDQHPESYDDQHTQETLLANFLQAEDWPLAHIALISLSSKDIGETSRAWNRLLQHYIRNHNHKEVVRIFDHMCSEQLYITSRSLNFMMKYLLPARAISKQPMLSQTPRVAGFDADNFVANAHMYATLHEQSLTPDRWVELLKRYGMTGRLTGLERLVHWLMRRHVSQEEENENVSSNNNNNKRYRLHHDISTLSKILNPVMLRAIIVWEFRYTGLRNNLQPLRPPLQTVSDFSWTRGITLLLDLKQMGLEVRTKDIRRAVTGILWMLFGPGVSKRRINLSLIRRNRLTIMDYVKAANNAWDTPLFEIPQNSDGIATEAQVLTAVFGSQRLASQEHGNWVDVDAWAAAKEEGSWSEAPPNLQDRHRAWSKSAFRFVDNFESRHQRQAASRKIESFGSKLSNAQHDSSAFHRVILLQNQQPDTQPPPPDTYHGGSAFRRINLPQSQHPAPQPLPSDMQDDGDAFGQITLPQSPQPAAQPLNWRPLPSQPSTPEEP